MTIGTILLAILASSAPPTGDAPSAAVFAYLKPSVAPVPANCVGAAAVAGMVRVPMFGADSAACPVARVGTAVITLGELSELLTAAHETRDSSAAAPAGKRPDKEFAPSLDRLIRVRLLTDEAQDMGMADLPEVKEALSQFEARVVRFALEKQVTAGVGPDPAQVEQIYRDTVREWKLKSMLFEKEADAKAFVAELKAGKDFDALAKQAATDKKGKGGGDAEYVSTQDARPALLAVIAKEKVGFTSGVVPLAGGFVVVRVDDIRYPDIPKARQGAEEASADAQRAAALEKFYDSLVKKYARIDQPILKKLDWEKKKPGYAALAKDQRPVVKIQGEKPVTVADLTAEMSLKFFHGAETPIKEKRVNREKTGALQRILVERLFATEASLRKLQDSAAVRSAREDYRKALLFSTFVEKVLAPGVKVTEADAVAYYEKHKAEFTYPQMYKLEALDFTSAKGAQSAVERLRAGTDFQWMRANADGQVKAEERTFPVDATSVLAAGALPPDLAKALAGSAPGDYRLYSPSDKEFYVVRVVENIAPKAQPYLEVRDPVARAVFDEKLKAAVQDYSDKLRAARDVEVYITRIGG